MDYDKRFHEMTENIVEPVTEEEHEQRMMMLTEVSALHAVKGQEFLRNVAAIMFVVLFFPVAIVAWTYALRYLF